MKVKLFELRDRGTFIPVMAVKLTEENRESVEAWLLDRAGLNYAASYTILLWNLSENRGAVDPYHWQGAPSIRTFPVCHEYLEQHFDELESGDVIDIQFIIGETTEKKTTERKTV